MAYHDCSQYKVELVWTNAVTYDSPMVLVRYAKGKDASFEILGVPTGIVTFTADEVAAAAPIGVADDSAPSEAAASAPDGAAASKTKRRRIVGKRASAGIDVVPRGDVAVAASADGPATATADAQPATGNPVAEHQAPVFALPLALLEVGEHWAQVPNR